jgi:signal transduction histidine kinase
VECRSHSPYCHTLKKSWVGNNLWDLRINDGSYEVREWISLAEAGGGWMVSYWKNPVGYIIPKYVYVVNVPTKNLALITTVVGIS